MKRKLFNYNCPPELIAQEPAQKRDESRLLVFKESMEIEDHVFSELPEILNQKFSLRDKNQKLLLIGNNSKVYPARLKLYRKTGAQCEIFVLNAGMASLSKNIDATCSQNDNTLECLMRPKSKLKENDILYLDQKQTTPVFQITDLKNSKIKPLFTQSLPEFLELHGETPLPPYIKPSASCTHKTRYQNVYANNQHEGSAAAPTAGFHFTSELLAKLPDLNIDIRYVTLHVGLGTFLPVKSDEISEHFMHEEYYCIGRQTLEKIFHHIQNQWPIVFIGTTALRAVESFFRLLSSRGLFVSFRGLTAGSRGRQLDPAVKPRDDKIQSAFALADQWHSTNLFIYPKNEEDRQAPLIGNALITNFHQPESSLLMLVASIIGFNNMQRVYDHALAKQYRFFSYGDSSLLLL